jgi:hypothetical protein
VNALSLAAIHTSELIPIRFDTLHCTGNPHRTAALESLTYR